MRGLFFMGENVVRERHAEERLPGGLFEKSEAAAFGEGTETDCEKSRERGFLKKGHKGPFFICEPRNVVRLSRVR